MKGCGPADPHMHVPKERPTRRHVHVAEPRLDAYLRRDLHVGCCAQLFATSH